MLGCLASGPGGKASNALTSAKHVMQALTRLRDADEAQTIMCGNLCARCPFDAKMVMDLTQHVNSSDTFVR